MELSVYFPPLVSSQALLENPIEPAELSLFAFVHNLSAVALNCSIFGVKLE
jgi:hypothetical protein